MSNAGTSILWSSARCREFPTVRKQPTRVWSYYAQVSIASPHGRIASGDALESVLARRVDEAPSGGPIDAAGRAGDAHARSEIEGALSMLE